MPRGGQRELARLRNEEEVEPKPIEVLAQAVPNRLWVAGLWALDKEKLEAQRAHDRRRTHVAIAARADFTLTCVLVLCARPLVQLELRPAEGASPRDEDLADLSRRFTPNRGRGHQRTSTSAKRSTSAPSQSAQARRGAPPLR